jgi:hypothetical protein
LGIFFFPAATELTEHDKAYVTNLNAALQAHVQALSAGDVKAQIALQQAMYVWG